MVAWINLVSQLKGEKKETGVNVSEKNCVRMTQTKKTASQNDSPED